MDAPGSEHADDRVALNYFGMVRDRARIAVIEKEGRSSQGQLDILELLNIVAEKPGLPALPMPMLVTSPETTPGGFIPPNRSEYAPIYI
jgi:hypothetical protein